MPRNNLLQDRSKGPNDRTPLVVTYSPQVRPLKCILNDCQPILDKNTSLSKAFGGRQVPELGIITSLPSLPWWNYLTKQALIKLIAIFLNESA
ncbi:hypothetical protein JRQ81_013256 [Phrynocephalus forsythii]|uniref:Uncharacterized protein n=1 Tax=Phrynocephalus forsythii TaxID=171643 RepID=A0A9Q0XYV2_9SAUR|nr:hypothetical protein JRQ81_013256 [Phrynocephalus forsythii]